MSQVTHNELRLLSLYRPIMSYFIKTKSNNDLKCTDNYVKPVITVNAYIKCQTITSLSYCSHISLCSSHPYSF